MEHSTIDITQVLPTSEVGRLALRLYVEDIVGRYYGRPASSNELDAVLLDDPSDDLAPPSGLFLVARQGKGVLGCAGLCLLGDGIGEVKRLFVASSMRGQGLGSRLLRHVEQAARDHAVARLRLDTRSDLVEARLLYAKHGYEEVEPFNDGQYAEHWFAKSLGPAEGGHHHSGPGPTGSRSAQTARRAASP